MKSELNKLAELPGFTRAKYGGEKGLLGEISKMKKCGNHNNIVSPHI